MLYMYYFPVIYNKTPMKHWKQPVRVSLQSNNGRFAGFGTDSSSSLCSFSTLDGFVTSSVAELGLRFQLRRSEEALHLQLGFTCTKLPSRYPQRRWVRSPYYFSGVHFHLSFRILWSICFLEKLRFHSVISNSMVWVIHNYLVVFACWFDL